MGDWSNRGMENRWTVGHGKRLRWETPKNGLRSSKDLTLLHEKPIVSVPHYLSGNMECRIFEVFGIPSLH